MKMMKSIIAGVIFFLLSCDESSCSQLVIKSGISGDFVIKSGVSGDLMVQATCGDGVTNGTETCDDGNLVSEDGCDSNCADEVIFKLGYDEIGGNLVSGLSQLSKNLTINGIEVAPSVWCEGQDAGASTWACDYGGTLAVVNGGADVTPGVAAPFTDGTTALSGGADYFQASANTVGDIGTEDFALEFMTKAPAATSFLAQKGGTAFWSITSYTTSNRLSIDDGPDNKYADSVASALSWTHTICFVNRDEASTNGMVCYGNATAGTGVDASSVGNMSEATTLKVLASATGALPFGSNLVHVAMWKYPSWHKAGADGPAEWAVIAKQRFYQLAGIYPQTAPTKLATYTRATTATLEIQDTHTNNATNFFNVGSGWPRVVRDCDSDECLNGVLAEPAITNKILQSSAFGTTWTNIDALDDIADGTTDIFGTALADGFTAGTGTSVHGVTQAVTLTAATHTFSVYAKPGNRDWLYLSDDTVANAYSYFNISSCALGTKGAGASEALVQDVGDYCRVSIAYLGTAASHTHKIAFAEADTDNEFAGDDATVSGYLLGAQVEAYGAATSFIATTTAQVTRNTDSLEYTFTGPNTGTMEFSFMCKSIDAPHTIQALFSLSDGTNENRVGWFINTNTSVGRQQILVGNSSVSNLIGTTDIMDNSVHSLTGLWGTSNNAVYIDDVLEASSGTSISIPSTTKLGISLGAMQYQPAFCIQNGVRIWNRQIAP